MCIIYWQSSSSSLSNMEVVVVGFEFSSNFVHSLFMPDCHEIDSRNRHNQNFRPCAVRGHKACKCISPRRPLYKSLFAFEKESSRWCQDCQVDLVPQRIDLNLMFVKTILPNWSHIQTLLYARYALIIISKFTWLSTLLASSVVQPNGYTNYGPYLY